MDDRVRWTTMLAAITASLLPPLAAAEPLENTYGHATPEEARAALNSEQAKLAQQQLAENAASLKAFEEATLARQAQIREQRNAHERLVREHEEAMARWREDVAACEAGNRSRCAPH